MAASESDNLIDQSEPLSAEELGKEMDDLLLKELVSTSAVLDGLRFKPKSKSKISIPLCRMISLPVVRPFLKNDVMGIGQDFVRDGYMDGRGVFYVAIHDNMGTLCVSQIPSQIHGVRSGLRLTRSLRLTCRWTMI